MFDMIKMYKLQGRDLSRAFIYYTTGGDAGAPMAGGSHGSIYVRMSAGFVACWRHLCRG